MKRRYTVIWDSERRIPRPPLYWRLWFARKDWVPPMPPIVL